jgi:hypothetical protein
VEHRQEKAVQGGLHQGRGRLYPGNGMGVKEGLSETYLLFLLSPRSYLEDRNPGFFK